MFICSDCHRLYDGVAVSVSEGPCEVCNVASPCGDYKRYTRKPDKDLAQTIKGLRDLLAAYVADEDRFNKGNGEPYGSISTETGMRARAALNVK